MRMKLKIPPIRMMIKPTTRRIRREKKPTMRETRRSMKVWNFKSREASELAVSADICRKGLNKVRIKEFIEKKSVILEKLRRIFSIKTCQPWVYHQEKTSMNAICIL